MKKILSLLLAASLAAGMLIAAGATARAGQISIDIADADVVEADPPGDPGPCAEVVVTLSAPSQSEITVVYVSVEGTAFPGDGNDYVGVSGQLTFDPGETEQTIEICIHRDNLDEGNEVLFVELSQPEGGATIADDRAEVLIVDDDEGEGAVGIAIEDSLKIEGDTGEPASCLVFTVSLSAPAASQMTVDWGTDDGTAAAAVDYVEETGTLAFAGGETEKQADVCIVGDDEDEPNETFLVNLTEPSQGEVTDRQGTMTIVDDDGGPAEFEGDGLEIELGEGDDDLSVTGDDNTIETGAGDDEVTVMGCNNMVKTGGGGDVVSIEQCANTARGGGGNDTFNAMNASNARRRFVAFQEGPDLVVQGGGGSDDLNGAGGVDKFGGGSGGDELSGLGGGDNLSGGGGKDLLTGGGGADLLKGGRGRDTCRGGRGKNRLRSCERRPRRNH